MEIVGWTSLYIPYLDETYSVDELTYMFETKYNIGKVKRIDMVRSIKKHVKTAFIHFETWYWNDFTQFLRRELEMYGKYALQSYSTYLQNKIERHSDCKTCVNLYQHKLAIYADEIDDITLLIHRTKYTHTHNIPTPLFEKPTVVSEFSKYSGRDEMQVSTAETHVTMADGFRSFRHAFRPLEHASKEGLRGNSREGSSTELHTLSSRSFDNQPSDLQGIIERHEKRIGLLEDEIQVLVNHYTNTQR
jgi:hypothetical protein